MNWNYSAPEYGPLGKSVWVQSGVHLDAAIAVRINETDVTHGQRGKGGNLLCPCRRDDCLPWKYILRL